MGQTPARVVSVPRIGKTRRNSGKAQQRIESCPIYGAGKVTHELALDFWPIQGNTFGTN